MPAKTTSLLLLAFIVASCAPHAQIAATVSPVTQTTVAVSPSSTSTRPASTMTAAQSPTASTLPIPTIAAVSVGAIKGNLFVRRGPDMAFNPVAVLPDGQSVRANGRDVLGKWLRIPVPGHPDQLGWVSLQTIYSAVSGDVTKLPEIEPTDWPVPAFLRNCTYHNMTAEPGGILLPALNNFPANDVRINPGAYRVYDTDVEGSPEVLKVELREGSAIDVRVDGDGEKRKCPQP